MIETIVYNDKSYPAFQASGNAARFIMPFANQFCLGEGYDIGCNRLEWKLPDIPGTRVVIPVDPALDINYDATELPLDRKVNFFFSSHCLEHIREPWFDVLEHWKFNVESGGVIFLYLPDYSQQYWTPWNNRKHIHIFTPLIMKDAFEALGMKKIFVSGVDLNNSFAIVGEV